jgi:tRNA(Ile)-lysidine synthase
LAAEWNPRIVDALANLGDLAYEEELWWAREGLTAPFGRGSGSGIEVGRELDSMPRAVARRLVRNAIRGVKGDLSGIEFAHVESVIEMDGRVRLPGVDFVRTREGIRAVRAVVPAVEVTVPGTYPAPDGASEIRLEPCVNLKADLSAPLLLRGWKPGDHYLRSGQSRDQKLKKMFEDARVPSWQRRFWPILEYGGRIVWAREFGPAEGSPVRVIETRRFV